MAGINNLLFIICIIIISDDSNCQDISNRIKEALRKVPQKLKSIEGLLTIPNRYQLQVSANDVSFWISTNEHPEPSKVFLNEIKFITTISQFDTNLDTVLIIHGWNSNRSSIFNTQLREAYLNVRNVNIVSTDWDDLAEGLYLTAFNAVPYVAEYVAQFIRNISISYDYSLDKFLLVGHSLGAHISGYAGQYTNGNLPIIVGLDPAGPLFYESASNERLSKDDAQYVISIHTNAGLFGVDYSVGHADFWPNGGSKQPGCTLEFVTLCSHKRAFVYFIESLLTKKSFVARKCKSYAEYSSKKCGDDSIAVMGGTFLNTSITGNYYLETNSYPPFALIQHIQK